MDENKVKHLFQQADTALDNARKELYQPAEDVVNYSVCLFSRNALYHFLSCLYIMYTRENNEPALDSPTLEQLIDYCSRYNDRLKTLDFSSVYCKGRDVINEDEIYYCNDVFKVKLCTGLAEEVKELVLEKA